MRTTHVKASGRRGALVPLRRLRAQPRPHGGQDRHAPDRQGPADLHAQRARRDAHVVVINSAQGAADRQEGRGEGVPALHAATPAGCTSCSLEEIASVARTTS